jgi:hypothetical protein
VVVTGSSADTARTAADAASTAPTAFAGVDRGERLVFAHIGGHHVHPVFGEPVDPTQLTPQRRLLGGEFGTVDGADRENQPVVGLGE